MRPRLLQARAGAKLLIALAAVADIPAVAGSPQRAVAHHQPDAVYVAHLSPVNTKVTGRAATGEASFTIKGDSLTITVNARGVSPNIMHWQHLHGFTDARPAACPTKAADANDDGIIDVIETAPMAQMTMVPFHDDPVSMEIARDTYPKASAKGALRYRKTVSLSALQEAFRKAFGGRKLDLDRRVFMMHGVPADTKRPASVASLGTLPAQVALPISCAGIKRLK
jgi:hypothetical protein